MSLILDIRSNGFFIQTDSPGFPVIINIYSRNVDVCNAIRYAFI